MSDLRILYNKNVLVRERKRHTASRVASARSAALSMGEYLHAVQMGITPSSPDGGTQDTPISQMGYPLCWPDGKDGVPHIRKDRVTPGWEYPSPQEWTDTKTSVKTLPSRRTTYAGGNNRKTQLRPRRTPRDACSLHQTGFTYLWSRGSLGDDDVFVRNLCACAACGTAEQDVFHVEQPRPNQRVKRYHSSSWSKLQLNGDKFELVFSNGSRGKKCPMVPWSCKNGSKSRRKGRFSLI